MDACYRLLKKKKCMDYCCLYWQPKQRNKRRNYTLVVFIVYTHVKLQSISVYPWHNEIPDPRMQCVLGSSIHACLVMSNCSFFRFKRLYYIHMLFTRWVTMLLCHTKNNDTPLYDKTKYAMHELKLIKSIYIEKWVNVSHLVTKGCEIRKCGSSWNKRGTWFDSWPTKDLGWARLGSWTWL